MQLPSGSRRTALFAAASVLAHALAVPAFAQTPRPASADTWPSKPVRLMVGFPPGSSPDFIARALAEPLAKALGQPVIVENRAGASGNIAAGIMAQSTDQHTLGIVINGNMTIAKLLNPATAYDPLKDLAPVSLICTAPLLLAAPNPATPSSTREFLEAARRAGNTWSYGSPGVGTVGHLAMEVLKSKAGLAPVHVPYTSYAQVVTAMISGDVHISLVQLGAAMPMVAAGKLRAIGVTSATRSPLAPDYPTLAEAGFPASNSKCGPASRHRPACRAPSSPDCPLYSPASPAATRSSGSCCNTATTRSASSRRASPGASSRTMANSARSSPRKASSSNDSPLHTHPARHACGRRRAARSDAPRARHD